MKKNQFGMGVSHLIILLVLTGMAPLFAIEINGKAPQYKSSIFPQAVIDSLNEEMKKTFDQILDEINSEVKTIDVNPQKLIGAFANSSVFSSDGASQRSYGGYKTFAVTLGPMLGFQLPSNPFTIMDEIDNIGKKLEEENDISLGLDPQAINAQIGINTSRFLLKDLYLGLKFGFMKLDDIENLSFETFSLGIKGNYQLFARKNIAAGLFLWRGITLGTGFIYQKTDLSYVYVMDTQSHPLGQIGPISGITLNPTLEIKPQINFDFNITTMTIPLEVMTSVRLLWFLNLAIGGGVDIGFGSAELKVTGSAASKTKDLPSEITEGSPASLSVEMGGNKAPNFFNPKLMAGVGLSLGPVVIDIPVTFYLENGYNVGVTVGVAW